MIDIRETPAGLRFAVRVSPGAARTKILGEHAGALKIAVSAAPEKGKANRALLEFLARALGLSRSAVSVVAGETSRTKTVEVKGFTPEALRAKITELAP